MSHNPNALVAIKGSSSIIVNREGNSATVSLSDRLVDMLENMDAINHRIGELEAEVKRLKNISAG